MKVRIKFSKQGNMKFIGHLDIMRYFQKALKRAGIPIRFTEGFSPHMILSFASPLGVGITSSGEYADLELTCETIEKGPFLDALNAQMVEGMEILDVTQIREGKGDKAMSLVAAADYTVAFRNQRQLTALQVDSFLGQEQIQVEKEGKKGTRLVNIRPFIYQMHLLPDSASASDSFFLRLSSGSADNVKPEAVMDALCRFLSLEAPGRCGLLINRLDLYALVGSKKGEPDRLVSLNDLGTKLT
ncbi:MAG: DUF2344 domain-containing protein [Lachnospiraceae bacterium]|nr:DUF2344 domain-containing protein [Lachnospiraceae bacterium]